VQHQAITQERVGVDPAVFRRVLGQVATSVSIVTGEDEAGPFGVVIGSLVSISLEPPLVGLFIDSRSTTLPRLLKCGEVCVNVLSGANAEFCRRFWLEREGRFQCGGWRLARGAAPRFKRALAHIRGRIAQSRVIGDHHLLVLETDALEDAAADPAGSPLLFFRGGFVE
jgi:3-hydroxy-9,10-secoandrosta-1,3,5(10)-triene-9,17-dione monooxygenase reductase component